MQHDGVDWSPRFGARCPSCGRYSGESNSNLVPDGTTTLPWDDETGTRIRYLPCPHCKERFKSVEKDFTSTSNNIVANNLQICLA